MDRMTKTMLFLILVALTIEAGGVAGIMAVSVRDYVERQCY